LVVFFLIIYLHNLKYCVDNLIQNINDANAFATNFMEVEYILDGNTKKANIKYANPSREINKLILETTSEINEASEINLLVTIRNREYTIKLK
jgi:hypothetical protein